MTIVIMAGGKGTRISSINSDVPKPMIRIENKPVLEYQIECFRKQGYTDIILVIGHLGKVIRDYFEAGRNFGVQIRYVTEIEPLGTAGALYYLKDMVTSDFLLVNGDILFDIDVERFYRFHLQCGHLATIFTHPNSHPYDSALVVSDTSGRVTQWIHKEESRGWYHNCVNAGIHFLSDKILEQFAEVKKLDLDRDILRPMIEQEELYAYQSPEYVRDMGTPERYYSVQKDIQSGLVNRKNLAYKQKAVFFDRDGTINQYVGFLRDINDFRLVDGIADYIKQVNEAGYLAIVITNQPVIARGEVSWEELHEIHRKMETLLGDEGAYLDDIFICPHHPDQGFEGELKEYKIQCDCRKPKPGLLLQAAEKYNIDLANSYMVGDSESDMEAGRAVGCQCVMVSK